MGRVPFPEIEPAASAASGQTDPKTFGMMGNAPGRAVDFSFVSSWMRDFAAVHIDQHRPAALPMPAKALVTLVMPPSAKSRPSVLKAMPRSAADVGSKARIILVKGGKRRRRLRLSVALVDVPFFQRAFQIAGDKRLAGRMEGDVIDVRNMSRELLMSLPSAASQSLTRLSLPQVARGEPSGLTAELHAASLDGRRSCESGAASLRWRATKSRRPS